MNVAKAKQPAATATTAKDDGASSGELSGALSDEALEKIGGGRYVIVHERHPNGMVYARYKWVQVDRGQESGH